MRIFFQNAAFMSDTPEASNLRRIERDINPHGFFPKWQLKEYQLLAHKVNKNFYVKHDPLYGWIVNLHDTPVFQGSGDLFEQWIRGEDLIQQREAQTFPKHQKKG